MRRRRHVRWMQVLAGLALLLAGSAAPGALAKAPAAPQAVLGSGFTYQGRLTQAGELVNGVCDLQFGLWDSATDGAPVGTTQTVTNVSVADGLFTVTLNAAGEFGAEAFTGQARWLALAVRCPAGSGDYAGLTPRQPIAATPYALSLMPGARIESDASVANLLSVESTNTSGERGGVLGQSASPSGYGLKGEANATGGSARGVWGTSASLFGAGLYGQGTHSTGVNYGVHGTSSSSSGYGVYGSGKTGVAGISTSTTGTGVYGQALSNGEVYGVRGLTNSANGFGGHFTNSASNNGVGVYSAATDILYKGEIQSFSGYGAYFTTLGSGGTGVYADMWGSNSRGAYLKGATGVFGQGVGANSVGGLFEGNTAVQAESDSSDGYAGHFLNSSSDGTAVYAEGSGAGAGKATLRAHNTDASGITAYFTATSSLATAHVQNFGTGQVLWLVNGGTDASGTSGGDFITAVNMPVNDTQFRVLTTGEVRSDVGFNTPAADFAEMLPAVPGLEPGDVLVIGPDGRLTRSTSAYQASVAGVYSTQPGFVGGQPMEGTLEGHVPLAVVGVVPVKVTAEGGPIAPGDLLTASSLPGHAMRAAPVTVDGVSLFPSGVVLGKALEGWEAGEGVIRILVVLQ